jgi:actin-related protein
VLPKKEQSSQRELASSTDRRFRRFGEQCRFGGAIIDKGILMNLIGKILTLLVFAMSVAFLVLALMVGNTHRNWKDVANENKVKYQEAERYRQLALESQTKKDAQLKAEIAARQQQIAQLYTQREIDKQARDAKEKELAEQLVISQERLQRMSIASDRVQQQDGIIRELQAERKSLIDQVSDRRAEVVAKTTEILELKTKVEDLMARSQDLNAQLARMDKVMKANGLTVESLTDQIPPRIEGIVMKVVDDDIVILSLGTDDGIREGHSFDIYRGDRFVGKAVVSKADYNLSAARVRPEFRQAAVLQGDHVTTKLPGGSGPESN